MGQANCCGQKQSSKKGQRTVQQVGRPKHRKRAAVVNQDPSVYLETKAMCKLAATSDQEFLMSIKTNSVTDLTKYKGYNMPADNQVICATGRQLHNTEDWNPLTYALVFDKQNLIQHILSNCYRIGELLALGNPGRDKSNTPFWDSDTIVAGKLKTLTLLAENKSPNLALVLNRLHEHVESRLLEKFLPLAARMSNCKELLETILGSIAFR